MNVIWLAGLSGAGKSTLARALAAALRPAVPVAIFDGDEVRAAIGDGLGYSEADRRIQIGRLASLASLVASQQIVVIVAAVYADAEQLRWNREHLPGYFEIHLAAALEALRARDTKRLYERAASGETSNVVGVDIPWRPPERPDLTLAMDRPERPDLLAREVLDAMAALGVAQWGPLVATTAGEWPS